MTKAAGFSVIVVTVLVLVAGVQAQGDDGFYYCAQEIESLAWRPDSQFFAAQGRPVISMYLPDLTHKGIFDIETRAGKSSDSPASCSERGIDWSPDGNYFVVTFHEGATTPISMELQIFDYNSREVIQELSIEGAFDILDIDWSSDGCCIAAIYRHWGPPTTDWSMRVWYRPDPDQINFVGTSDVVNLWTFESVRFTDLSWSFDSEKLAISNASGDVEVWDTTVDALDLASLTSGGSPPDSYILNTGHIGSVNAIAWHPAENILATGGEDGTIKLWDMNNNVELATIAKQDDAMTVLDWNTDGDFLAAGDAGGLIKIWDTRDGTLVDTLEWHRYMVHTLDWSPDGNYISSAARDHSLHIWDVSGIRSNNK